MPKLSLFYTVLLASLSVSVFAIPNELTKRSPGIFGSSSRSRSGSGSSKGSGPIDPINHNSGSVTCDDITYGPEDFRLAVQGFHNALTHESVLREQRPDFLTYITPMPGIPKNRFRGVRDGNFYCFPLIKGGSFPHQLHNSRDFAIISGIEDIVVEVVMIEGESGMVPCVRN
ncbi:hypothetical protein K3495_g13870 [Podosphaera aphanis]|nr:hypothetical protein K3495_g13870 [Podosphaera aphanis]